MTRLYADGKEANAVSVLVRTLMKESRTLRHEKNKLNGVLWSIYGNCQCAISNIEDHKALEVFEMISKKCEEVIYDKRDSITRRTRKNNS